ncbi:protein ADM2 [Orycteropus afer afer]|uniref:Protein ADM2 n=1 Tax=Orycteropus afer afer TaxID=1230840 RepID=A0A8B7B2N6_ORYAF|nr:protein ADM2 [Orycteropus afer afer]
MARLLALTFGCISLLHLQLPGALTRGLGGRPRPARPREPLARIPSSGPHHRHPTPQPVVEKLHLALQSPKGASLDPAMGQPLQHPSGHPTDRRPSGRRHPGPRRAGARLLRVGCMLGTCQVENLSHRLWQLVGQAGQRDLVPVDPRSPHSYG